MTDASYTHATFIVDCSGSMQGIASDMSGGINQLIKDQKEVDGRMTVSLVEFASFGDEKKVWDFVDLKFINTDYSLQVRGMTALNDAVGNGINNTGKHLAALHESQRPGKVIFVIVTDGYENHSREFTAAQIKKMIEAHKQDYNWDFLFLGANIDAFAEGSKLGVQGIQYAATGQSVNSAYRGMSKGFTSSRVASAAGGEVAVASAMATDYSDPIDEE